MKRVLGILCIVLALYGLLRAVNPAAGSDQNHRFIAERLGTQGFLALGAGILIISGGIDLSIGSVFCLAAVSLGLMLKMTPEVAQLTYLLVVPGGFCFVAGLRGWVHTARWLRSRVPGFLAWPLGAIALPLAPAWFVGLLYFSLPRQTHRQRVLAGVTTAALVGILAGSILLDPVLQAVLSVVIGAGYIGLLQGTLISGLRLQPFVVTLCGLFIWRGLAYLLALPRPLAALQQLANFLTFKQAFPEGVPDPGSSSNVGIAAREAELQGLIFFSTGYPDLSWLPDSPALAWLKLIPVRLWLLLLFSALAIVFMHFSVYGRYVYAVGANEQAAEYAGIDTRKYKLLPYILCSMLAAVGGMLELLELKTSSPSNTGKDQELVAITGAVLGGCSLRGGEGTVIGILLGTSVLPLLNNLCNLSGLTDDLQKIVIGAALLVGIVADELLKRRAEKRKG